MITPNHQSVSGSIPHSRVINVSGSPQIASQWILDPCLHRPELLAEMSISQAKKILNHHRDDLDADVV